MTAQTRRIAINSGGAFVLGSNAVVAGAVMAAHELGWEVVAINDGYEGLLFPDRYSDRGLKQLDLGMIDGLVDGNGAALGMSRTDPFHVRTVIDDCVEEIDRSDELLAKIRAERIEAVISVASRRAMSVVWKLERKGLQTLCVPESVENDLAATALSFGFNSALNFTIEMLDRIRIGARAAHKIAVVEVLGQHAGWLALQAGIALAADAALIPEIPYDLAAVAARLKRNQQNGRPPALVVVAQGARPAVPEQASDEVAGAIESRRRALSPGSSSGGTSHGSRVIDRSGVACDTVALELQRRCDIETLPFVLGPLIRGGRLTPTDRQLGLAYGAAAVRGLHDGHSGEMVAFQPPQIVFVPLAEGINIIRSIPPESQFILAARALGISLGSQSGVA